ncbi:MAG TPA: hypothetical protein VKD90_13905 [Gemmataceae bacterium]|nr:hypothetical protein [Gemmataceae bacterium]
MDRRTFLAALPLVASRLGAAPQRKTTVTVRGNAFHINDEPTYKGRTWNGKKVEGLLFNSRMVQGIFDDRNPDTRKLWAYPDTGKWDPDRNTREFVAAMPAWRRHGLLAFTINLQGGSPQGYSKDQPWENSAFDPDGSLRDDYLKRLASIFDNADELGMVVILGYFYFGQDQRLKDETAVKTAARNATGWVLNRGYTNLLIEVNNECDVARYDHAILKPARVPELIRAVKEQGKGHGLLVGTSFGGGSIPTAGVAEASDFLLLHGNGVKDPKRIADMVRKSRDVAKRKLPILFNEDDHFDFDKPQNNRLAALGEYASWGYFDFRMNGEGFDDGYQSVPVNWRISSARKKAFFGLMKEITGS